MALDLLRTKGTPPERQTFTWRDLVQPPYSKLDDDAFTRVRVILMNGIESEAVRFRHSCARMNASLQQTLAEVRRVEQHQQTLVNWLNPADQSPLETTIGFEQVAIEVTASVVRSEPDPYLAQIFRFGLLEDFDHREGSPSQTVAAGWVWTPGTELAAAAEPIPASGKAKTRNGHARSAS
jgi:hypothetical protein